MPVERNKCCHDANAFLDRSFGGNLADIHAENVQKCVVAKYMQVSMQWVNQND